ncbi:MAG: TolB family protein [Nitrospirota bacterium]
MKGIKMAVLLVVIAFLLGVRIDDSRAADTKQKRKADVPRKVNMDSNLRKKLNTFFSNFSEAPVKPFTRDKIENKELISFGVSHNWWNRFDRFKCVGSECRLKASYVEEAVEKYFGRRLKKHGSVPPHIKYKNGYYYVPGAAGEAPDFSQIVELVDIGNNFFVATVDVYARSCDWEGDPHGTPEQWRREDPYEVPERVARMTATIRKIRSDKGERYILLEYLRADDTKQKGGIVKSPSAAKEQEQQTEEVVPPLPNSINIGGISIGITEFTREKNIALVRFIFRCINEGWFPRRFLLLVTDDRGNEYEAMVYHYPFLPMPLVGSTWITNPPVIIRIPKIAPISKFELIPETAGSKDLPSRYDRRFNLDYRKLTPLPPLNLKFRINPEQILAGKEMKQDENISIWLGEPKIEEKEEIKEIWGARQVEKTISVKVPVTIENRDYTPRTAEMPLSLEFQLNSGGILSEDQWRQPFRIHSRTVDGASKQTYEESFKIEVERDEHVQLISVYRSPVVPFPGVFAVAPGYDPMPKFLGFLYISERDIIPSEIALPSLSPRKPVPSYIEDGDWFPDGSKIVLSEKTEKIKEDFWGKEVKEIKRRIFIMNPDGTDKKEIKFKKQEHTDHVAPLVSPDGKKIVFVATEGYLPIYVMDADGSNIRHVAFGDSSLAYAWVSNDKIVLWKSPYGAIPDTDIFYTEGKIYIYDIDGLRIETLKTPPPELLKGKFVGSEIKDFQK